MASDFKRYARQMKLAEVGRANQAKLRAANVIVPGGDLAARVEALYLAGAGVGNISVAESLAADVAAINPEVVVRGAPPIADRALDARAVALDIAAARVASGAFRALAELKEIFSR